MSALTLQLEHLCVVAAGRLDIATLLIQVHRRLALLQRDTPKRVLKFHVLGLIAPVAESSHGQSNVVVAVMGDESM